jgi:hypothetical protein
MNNIMFIKAGFVSVFEILECLCHTKFFSLKVLSVLKFFEKLILNCIKR